MDKLKIKKVILTLTLTAVVSVPTLDSSSLACKYDYEGEWVSGDVHTHTFLTDGSNTLNEILSNSFGKFGLDWMANSEHGGSYYRDPYGNVLENYVWRWMSLKYMSYPVIKDLRRKYPDKMIVQGLEWNVPTHQHASVGIISDEPTAISNFEYIFDEFDSGTSRMDEGLEKNNSSHRSAVAGAKWLQDNYRNSSYLILNHPSKDLKYTAADIRDLNNAAPDVCLGFEGFPGHQKGDVRGNYYGVSGDDSFKSQTYGGVDYMLAKVGGLWDALLGEGRRFWVFANSDFHNPWGEFWPGEYVKSYTFVQKHDYKSIVAGLHSGNSYSVSGDLINDLTFNIQNLYKEASIGQNLRVRKGSNIEITIKFRSPEKNNNNDSVTVDHIDLIAGEVTGKAKLGTDSYKSDTNITAKVVARFTNKDWKTRGGWNIIKYRICNVKKNMYYRLRGTNLGLGVENETDEGGNPLSDTLMGINDAQKAYKDLWFYSNPIYVSIK